MKKLIVFLIVFLAIAVFLTGCGRNVGNNIGNQNNKEEKITKENAGENMCAQFDANFMYSVLGKPIAYLNAAPLGEITYCQYFTEYKDDFYKQPNGTTAPGGPWFSANLSNLSVENQKKAAGFLDREIKADERIKMENFLTVQKNDGLIDTIYLIFSPERFISLRRSDGEVLTNEEMIGLAIKMVEKINGKLSLDLKENPLGNEVKLWGKAKDYKVEPVGESQKAVAESFFNFLSEKKWDDATAMMDSDAGNKDDWKTNFQILKKVEVKSVEPIFLEEWTADIQKFKAILEVKGEGYGWHNGSNPRWLSLKLNNGVWQVHELANNP